MLYDDDDDDERRREDNSAEVVQWESIVARSRWQTVTLFTRRM